MTAINKRDILQTIIDDLDEPWIIMKPSRHNPMDPDPLCVFENPAAQTQAREEIPLAWFEGAEVMKIKEAVHSSLRHAQVMHRPPSRE